MNAHHDGSCWLTSGLHLMPRLPAIMLLTVLWWSTPIESAVAAIVPPGFSETVVASGLERPTAMTFGPDGRLFVCEQGGRLRVVSSTIGLLPAPFVTLTVDSAGERGLLGVAFDPAFAINQFVYVYYTATTPTIHNRVSRFTANGDVAVPGSEVVILDLETLSNATNHNGGAIHFGPDGTLFVAVGDNANGANSQSLSTRLGKMLRINADGSIPTDNPFYTMATGANRAIWAMGLRNPFTFAMPSYWGPMVINDVGESQWEEINLGLPGANYGWPASEGFDSDPRFVSPIYEYDHTDGCAITGGAFYVPQVIQFPDLLYGVYFFADFCGGWIRASRPGTGIVAPFASALQSPVDLAVSNDGALYYLARGTGTATGTVGRFNFERPSVNLTANGSEGPLVLNPGDPLRVALSVDAGSIGIIGPVEIYFGVSGYGGTLWLDPVTHTFVSTPTPLFTGAVPSLGPITMVDVPDASAALTSDRYWWFTVVDTTLNGRPDYELYDYVETNVP